LIYYLHDMIYLSNIIIYHYESTSIDFDSLVGSRMVCRAYCVALE